MAAIAGASELLEEDNVPPAQKRRFLSNIRTESKRIQSLVDRMLTLCALEHRETIERREIVDMNMVLADVLRRSGQEILTREICIVKILAMACECPGDAFLITQAVMNLFQNAVEFSPRGAADTGVTLKRSGETVVVEIRDQGPGIPEFARNKIFDRFFSIQRPDTRKKSTGLGLNFVREIVLLHGGSIDVKNNPDFGVRAVLRLPAA